jgi:hypothetical protein
LWLQHWVTSLTKYGEKINEYQILIPSITPPERGRGSFFFCTSHISHVYIGMTVQQLIEKLQQVEDKSKICLADDGNGWLLSEITSVQDAQYVEIKISYSGKYNNI